MNSEHAAGDGAQISDVNPDTVTIVASPSIASVNDTITFFANASSFDPSATLTFTIFYDYYDPSYVIKPDSPVTINTTGSPGSVVRTFTYNHTGNLSIGNGYSFWVQLNVSDGAGNETASNYVWVAVNPPPVNQPPSFIYRPVDPLIAPAGVTKNMQIKVADNEGDNVVVFWDFGDGTNATNATAAPKAGIVLIQPHAWNPRVPGKGDYVQNYTLNVSLSDGLHPLVNSSTNVSITVPANGPPNILDPGIAASEDSASPLEQISFSAAASDPEGDPFTWTYIYSDGSADVYHSGFTAPNFLMWQNASHTFASIGNYSVSLSVSDALVPNQIGNHNITVRTTVRISLNVPPTALSLNVEPSSPLINATLGYTNVTLSVEAWDLNGDIFTLSWDLGVFGTKTNDSVGDAAQRMKPYTFRQSITFNKTGSYPFAVTVTDGLPDHEVRLTAVANVSSTNQPPIILVFNHAPYSLGDFAAANESVAFRLVVTDPERDSIELIWDFGDGSAKQYMNRSDYDVKGNMTVVLNHTFVLKGYYNVTLTVTDNKIGSSFNHTLITAMPIQVSVRPPVTIVKWTWWDYVSLSIFASIPVLIVLWGFIGMYRRRREELRRSLSGVESGAQFEKALGDSPEKGHEEGG